MRDTLAAVHSDAGVVVGSETRHLLPGSGEKPADVHAHGIGNQGRDIAIDVAIVNKQRFMAKWRTRIAMALAKRGAQVAIRRSHAIQCCCRLQRSEA